jgi:hypothetical protein
VMELHDNLFSGFRLFGEQGFLQGWNRFINSTRVENRLHQPASGGLDLAWCCAEVSPSGFLRHRQKVFTTLPKVARRLAADGYSKGLNLRRVAESAFAYRKLKKQFRRALIRINW